MPTLELGPHPRPSISHLETSQHKERTRCQRPKPFTVWSVEIDALGWSWTAQVGSVSDPSPEHGSPLALTGSLQESFSSLLMLTVIRVVSAGKIEKKKTQIYEYQDE